MKLKGVSWSDEMVSVELSKESIKNRLDFDPSASVNRDHEIRLYDFYGCPKYWA